MIKKIGVAARKDMESLLGNKIYLSTFVKVEEDWRNNAHHLKEYGYNSREYKLLKNNIVSAGYEYVSECTNGILDCNFDFNDNNKFKAGVLKQYGYFNNLNSPIDNKNLEDCLILEVTKDNGVVVIELEDKCY